MWSLLMVRYSSQQHTNTAALPYHHSVVLWNHRFALGIALKDTAEAYEHIVGTPYSSTVGSSTQQH